MSDISELRRVFLAGRNRNIGERNRERLSRVLSLAESQAARIASLEAENAALRVARPVNCCHILSRGDNCDCTLCRLEREVARLRQVILNLRDDTRHLQLQASYVHDGPLGRKWIDDYNAETEQMIGDNRHEGPWPTTGGRDE
jgi:hypothetical protein